MPDAETSRSIIDRFKYYAERGHRIEYVDTDFVRNNWNEHLDELPTKPAAPSPAKPVQLNLFDL